MAESAGGEEALSGHHPWKNLVHKKRREPIQDNEFMCTHSDESKARCAEVLRAATTIVLQDFQPEFVLNDPLNALLLYAASYGKGVSILADQWSRVQSEVGDFQCDEILHGLAATIVKREENAQKGS